jgi:hypothetical protein
LPHADADAVASPVPVLLWRCGLGWVIPMTATPKARILALAKDQNLSESFGAVLHLVAFMDSGKPLVPDSEEERLSWAGYRRGHLSALLCMAMHEQQCVPTDAVVLVSSLLDKARVILRPSRPEGEA